MKLEEYTLLSFSLYTFIYFPVSSLPRGLNIFLGVCPHTLSLFFP